VLSSGIDTQIGYSSVEGITVTGVSTGAKTRVVRTLTGYGSGVQFGVHNSSMANLMRGVAERVLYIRSDAGELTPARKPLADVFMRLGGVKTKLLRKLVPTTVVPKESYSLLYSGRKKLIYQRAYESLVNRGITRKDSYVSTFVKAEKVNFSVKGDPAPRVIQPRSPRYNLEVGRYLKLFEKELVRGFRRGWGYDVILKGKNADGVAQSLRDNWDVFHDPVCIGLDASRFDQHVSVEALLFEHSIYNSVFRSPELARLLRWQLRNTGFGRIGDQCAKYVVDGCRMSGDINTGMGNCLIMSAIVLAYFEHHHIDARLANNGDDCVVFIERKNYPLLKNIDQWFTDFGFKLKREPLVDVFERVEFCQAQPVLVGNGWRMVRNPWTAMSKDCVSLLSWDSVESFDVWRDAIAVCGGELTSGVPLWQSFYDSIRSGGRTGGVDAVYDTGMGMMARGVRKVQHISSRSRFSFWLAFGIDPDLQTACENSWPGVEYTTPPLVSNTEIPNLSKNPICLLNLIKP